MMILLLLGFCGIGALEWWLALRRTLACARGQRGWMFCLVRAENLLGLSILSLLLAGREAYGFAGIAAYSLGGALATLMIPCGPQAKPTRPRADVSTPQDSEGVDSR